MKIKITSEFSPRQAAPAILKQVAKETKVSCESKNAAKLDTFEKSIDDVFADTMRSESTGELYLDGPLPASGTLEYFDPIEHDGIDWERLEKEFFGNRQITIDNADSLMGNVDHMASMYVAVKNTLEQKFAGQEDVLSVKMERLNSLLDKAKRQMTSSYRNTVGHFYESMGNKGAASAMSSDLSDAIDRRIAEMEETTKSMESFENETSYTYKQLVIEVWAFNQRENGNLSKAASDKDSEHYSLEDLEAAGMAAKAAANMSFANLRQMSDGELGISLAFRYMKMDCLLGHTGVSKDMSDMILKSFGTFLNKYTGNILSGNGAAAKAYEYTLKQYDFTGNMKEAITQSGRKYAGDGFFSDFLDFGNDTAMSLATRYNLDIDQFMSVLAVRGPSAVLASVSGTGRRGFSVYI